MNRLYNMPIKASWTQDKFVYQLRGVIEELRDRLPKQITNRLEAIDFQNCLCEFDKYERTLFDNRRPKARYPGI